MSRGEGRKQIENVHFAGQMRHHLSCPCRRFEIEFRARRSQS